MFFLAGESINPLWMNGYFYNITRYFKRMYRFLLFTFIFCFSTTISFAQTEKEFDFKGKVYAYGDPLEGVSIHVLKSGEVIDSMKTSSNGKFSFTALGESEYMLVVFKEGFHSKTLWLNTKKTKQIKFKIETFKFDVRLKRKKEGEKTDLEGIPVALIKYDENKKAFYMDDTYDDLIDRKKAKIKEKKQYRPRPN